MATPTPVPGYPTHPDTSSHALPDTPARAFVRGAQEGAVIGRYRRELAASLMGDVAAAADALLKNIPVPAVFQRAKTRVEYGLLGAILAGQKAKNQRTLRKAKSRKVGVPRPGRLATPDEIKRQMERPHPQDWNKPRPPPGTQEYIPRGKAAPKAETRLPPIDADIIRRPQVSIGRGLDIPGIRARVGAPYHGGAVLDAGNQLVTIYTDLWYQQKRIRERRRQLLSVGRRGAAATRPVSGAVVPGRRGGDRGQPRTIPQSLPIPGTVSAPAPAPVPAPTQGVPGRRGGGLATRDRSTTGHAPAYRDLSQMAQASLSSQIDQFLTGRTSRRPSAPRMLSSSVPLPVVSPLSAPVSTTTTAAGPAVSNAVGSAGKQKNCECEKPKKEQKKFHCSNPLVSRSVTKDGIITIKRKLQCQPSKRK